MTIPFTVIIPARYQSSRLPAKPLADIGGKPMIQWVVEKALASGAKRVIVATDDERIETAVKDFGGEVCMTSVDHNSGTERLAEVCDTYDIHADEIIVNVQGDEPLIPSENISQVAENLAAATEASMSTLAVKIDEIGEVFNPNSVKVLTDKNGYALYFSRASIPYDRDGFKVSPVQKILDCYLRHVGIYAYRVKFIKEYIAQEPSQLENIEALEQLRVLWHGQKIHVAVCANTPPAGVDTPEDLERVREHVKSMEI
mmetsp:Transcript_39739/g.55175  ORF Transcript_39739/g.55175 Transcript_39739/m.55175 type:complete len:257 (-) Transcript_39739:81-851(-)|eukprot:CAMPEP_0196590372 /NCGR_PEP_ID=MMETSP1081-20130531/66458_1 /TAXON_ID=36882 /ORGANISM="Pyramimonas amylifera, Strain CCMP720" /LENGTH=256 /DNA_ID=CAMNT_0041913459 /DNA_START=51 /DNA_END=821 /DNA_ORIENTATION=-